MSNGLLNLATANNSLLSLYIPTVVINVLGSLKYVGCTKEPSEAEVKIIKELFEKSVDGEAYDLEKYGQYFRPAGLGAQVSIPKASRPAPVEQTADPVNAEVKTAEPVAETTPAAQPSTDSAKRAEDILKLIRSSQAK